MKFDPTWVPCHLPAPDPIRTLAPEMGLTLRWFNFPPYHDEPKLWHLSASLSAAEVGVAIDSNDGDSGEVAGGSSLELERALAKLAGEAVERYATSRDVSSKPQKLQSWRGLSEAGLKTLDPVEIAIADEGRKEHRRDEQVIWVQGFDLRFQETIFVPAQLVFVPHIFADDEAVWRAPISTGAAAHSTIEGALYAGLCEVIERDAFQVAWLRQLKLSRLDPPRGFTDTHRLLESLIEAGKRYHLRCEMYRLPCSLPLTICMAVIWDDTGVGPRCAVAAKCSPSDVVACLGALEEAYQMRSWLRRLLDTSGASSRSGQLNTLMDRAKHWLTPEAAEVLATWTQQATPATSEEKASLNSTFVLTLDNLIKTVVQDGGSLYAVDLTAKLPNCIRQLGWRVTKVVVPQFQPLNLTEEMEDFALERLENAETRLGVEAAVPLGHRHQYPHPFL